MFYAGTLSMGIIIRAEDLDSGEYDHGGDDESQPGEEDGDSGDQAVQRGPGVGRVTAIPGIQGSSKYIKNYSS